jgi:hypothetical protein
MTATKALKEDRKMQYKARGYQVFDKEKALGQYMLYLSKYYLISVSYPL